MSNQARAFIHFLIDNEIEFSCTWDEFDLNYQIHIILDNVEHIIDFYDTVKMADVQYEILNY